MIERRSRLAPVLPLVLLGLLLTDDAAAAKIKEPETGVLFPTTRSWGRHKMRAVGAAVREKFGFDVSAGCFYIDAKLGKEKLLAFLGSDQGQGVYAGGKLDKKKLLGNAAFFRWLIRSDLPMSIDMTFVRDVGEDKVKNGYRKGLDKTLKDKAVRDRFVAQIKGEIKEYKHITLNFLPGGKVILQYMGKTHKAIVSKPLARALLSIYFGARPINNEIKRNLVGRIDGLLK
jgi:hypothetical protein